MHIQKVYTGYPRPSGLPISEAMADVMLGLPMHTDLDGDIQEYIADSIPSYRSYCSVTENHDGR